MLKPHRAIFYRKIVVAKLYIDNYYAESINVHNVACDAGFSRYDFIRQFHKTYGMTPHQYLTKVRLEKAAELLGLTEAKVIDVCVMVGFSSPSSFSHLFRRTFGLSPRSYQMLRAARRRELSIKPRTFVPNCFQSFYEPTGDRIDYEH